MIISSPTSQENPRLIAFGIAIMVGLGVLLVALARVQIWRGEHFENREEAQQLRRIRLPAARGDIVDRNGVVLANNRPSYDIVIYLEQIKRDSKKQDVVRAAGQSLSALSQALGQPVTLADRDVRIHYSRRRPIPMPVWRDVPTSLMAAFAERASNLPGADLIVTPVREYPLGALAAHTLGFVGKAEASTDEELEHYYYYQPDSVGKQGVERSYDEFLRGEPGGKTIRVSPGGTMVGEIGEKAAVRGNRVTLTLDARWQQLAETALRQAPLPAEHPLRGAAVVLDARTGAVLAMASLPAFDPNIFNPGVPGTTIQAVLQDPQQPMLNRAYGGLYAPGSTFKPVTLLAGLESRRLNLADRVVCGGGSQIGNRFFGCWKRTGHGSMDGAEAMRQSCDVWYYQKGMATGVEQIERMARQFGMGRATGLDVGREFQGIVPSPDWKRRERQERWWDGDTAQLSIGQSFLLTTPLQMAVVAAAFGNGGQVVRPYVVQRIESPTGELLRETKPVVTSVAQVSPQNLETVRRTMLGAVQETDGTAHRAMVAGLSVAGKTGTAEFDWVENGVRRRVNRAWFIGFAPYDRPQVAVAVVLEDADSGGHTAAPVAGQILAGIFQKQREPVTGGGGD